MSLPTDFIAELRKQFTGDIRLDLGSRILYSTDASIYQIEPLGVVISRNQEDLHAAVELAAKYKIPVLPRGAGTSLAGQAIGQALILDCSRWLDNILEINPETRTAIVEPGVILASLNSSASKYGLQFGPDPASAERATMGGVIGNNATGAHSILYGMTADHLLSTDVILANGSLATFGEWKMRDGTWRTEDGKWKVVDTPLTILHEAIVDIREKYTDAIKAQWPVTWRNSAGYRLNYLLPWLPSAPPRWVGGTYPANLEVNKFNLSHLLAGSEGTLAVIRRAKINLVPKPKHTILSVLSYESIADACDDVPRLLLHHPSAIELIPRLIMQQAHSVPAYARQMGWVVGDPAALLVIEFGGDQPAALKEAARSVGEVLTIAESVEDQARVWNVRKVGLGLLDSRPQSARPIAFIEDCAIPVQHLGEFVREVERILSEHGTEGGIYAHASAGCLHIRPILNLKTARGVNELRVIAEAVLALTLKLGGAMSSEHGDGLARSEWLERTYGRELMDAMRQLKRAADPNNLLNPGKIIDAPKMDVNLRYGSDYVARVWMPSLSFERNNGLAGAIEQCNGQGVCRKMDGVMCPSFQVTREEMHATRGRANLLRALITSPISLQGGRSSQRSNPPFDEVTSSSLGIASLLTLFAPRNDGFETVYRALDLCLMCRGCTSECPSGVDMPKLKSEFLHEYYKTHRRPLRDYLFGYFHVAAGFASSFAPLTNMLMQIPAIKNILAKILGIAHPRPFPKFAFERARASRIADPTYGRIIFLSDPFSRYIEPQVEQAAFDVLSRCGYDVQVLPVVGAGASLLSKGFVEAARRHAHRVLDALNRIDPACEAPIVGIEPPELYCLKNDYYDLLPGRDEEISHRATKVWLVEEFLLRSNLVKDLRVANMLHKETNKQSNKRIKFHPHCHQRAEGPAFDDLPSGTNATVELLRACGYEVEVMDTGCCGMAGTFGYEAEHYELSQCVGELRLFPIVRESRDISIVSTGAACRMQIFQGTGVNAEHPIVLAARAFARLRAQSLA